MAQHQRLTGPLGVNAQAPFSQDMVEGYQPEQPRLFFARNRLGLSLSQPTHVQAAFSPEMSAGNRPDLPRLFKAKQFWTWQNIVITQMTTEMFEGEMPTRPRLVLGPRIGQPISQTTFDFQMTPEVWEGDYPARPRLPFVAPIGWQISQPTHTAAPFGAEMAEGYQPDRPRLPFTAPAGWQNSQTTFLVQMTVEQFGGSHPDTSRAWIAPRIPGPESQTSHVQAAFSTEMVQGNKPDQKRPHILGKGGWIDNQTTFLLQMTAEMFAGWHPDRNRERLGPRLGQPLSQTTHTAAPFSFEMTQGNQPARNRVTLGKQIVGWIQGLIDGLFGVQAVKPVGQTHVMPNTVRFASAAQPRLVTDFGMRTTTAPGVRTITIAGNRSVLP